MKALQIDHHGPPAELKVREISPPPLKSGEVRIEVQAAGVNPSDALSAEGRFPNAPLPRVLGRDFAGRVIEGPPEWKGVEVYGTGGDLGIARDGTHAEQLVLPVEAIARRPSNLSIEEAGSVGVPFLTAWTAVVELGSLAEGQWVIVSGAAGAVGRAATELSVARGAQVIALVKDDAEAQRVNRQKVAAVATSERGDLTEVVRRETGGKGAQLALNGVGGAIFQSLFEALAPGGRMVVYSAAAGREAPLDLFELYRRRIHLAGLNTGNLDAAAGARVLSQLTPLFESGKVSPLQGLERHPLSSAASVYARVAQGSPAKLVLVPSE